MTDVPPTSLPDSPEPPHGRVALLVAGLRGGVAALGALWIVATDRGLRVRPWDLLGEGIIAFAIAAALLFCLWRTRMSRSEIAASLLVLVGTPLLGLALIESPTFAFASLVGVLVVGALLGALGATERAALMGVSPLRGRMAVALGCGVGAFFGCGVVVLQAGFTWGAVSATSVEGGYASVHGLIATIEDQHLVQSGLIAGLVMVVTLARLCHARLRDQLLSCSWLAPSMVVMPVVLVATLRADALLAAPAIAWALLLTLRGLDALERSVLHAPRPAPLGLPAGTGRRVVLTAVVALVSLAALDGALTATAARLRAQAFDDLVRRNEPTAPDDLPTPREDEDAFVLYQRAAVAFKPPSERPNSRSSEAETIAMLTSFQVTNATALALFEEGARRPRCRFVPNRARLSVTNAASELLEGRFTLLALQGDVDGAVDVIRLRRALFANAEPAYAWNAIGRGFAQAQHLTLELLARHDLSIESCRESLKVIEPPLESDFVARAVQKMRLDLVDARAVPDDDYLTPPVGQLSWFRDLDLVEALARVDVLAAAARDGGVAALQSASSTMAEPSRWRSLETLPHEWANELVSFANEYELRRRMCVIALSLRLHRLATGSYPTTLDALVPGQLTVVPFDLAGTPFVYTLDGAGFTLAPAGQPRPILRIKR